VSNRKRPKSTISEVLAALDGACIPGGCDTCDAYQQVVAHADGLPNVTRIKITHDAWCPTYRRMTDRGQLPTAPR
jgi:hypothetical protein